jgi:hypothetical protein
MSNVQSYNALIDRFHAFASGHFILKRFSHGQIEVSDLEKFGEYPFMHVVPSNVTYSKGMKTFSFQIVLADLPRDKEDKPEYQREVLSDLQRIAEDLVAEITNHRVLFGDLITVQNVTLEPFLEEFHHTLTGWTISLDLLVPYYWDACSIPAEWNDFFESGSGGTGSILTFIDSITRDENGNVSLVNDEATPAPNYYYGTNGAGVRGWYLTTDNIGLTCETIGDCQTIIDIEAAIDALEEEIVLKADITSISAVGFSNDYNDLDNKPTIPTATSDLTNDSGFITIGDVPAQVNADWNATSGVAEILNKPTIPAAQIQSDWTQANNAALDFIKNKPTIPAAQVNSDWNATSGVAEILNKPTLTNGTVTSIGLTMPSAFSVANSPITTSGTLAVTGAGTVSQYVRGDGSLANFPSSTGGGASLSFYLNGSVAQGTFGGIAFKEMDRVPVLGAGTDFTINANGYIQSFITDANVPNQLEIPAGNWNFETYFSASSNGGTPSFYVELYKWNGATLSLIASNSATPEGITNGTAIDAYFSALAVPQTTLAATDRLAIRIYVTHSGRTITLHTENSHLCEVITTFSTGLTALNGLTAQVQNFATGTTGTDFGISSATSTHTFNLPTASAANRGALSATDWSTFNGKFTLPSLTSGSVLFSNGTTIAQNNANFFWDNTNARLTIGTSTGVSKINLPAGTTLSDGIAFGSTANIFRNVLEGISIFSGSGTWQFNSGILYLPTNQGSIIRMNPGRSLFIDNGTTFYLSVNGTTGNVLIGTTTDAGYKLDVNGTARVSGATTLAGVVAINSTNVSTGYALFVNGVIGVTSITLTQNLTIGENYAISNNGNQTIDIDANNNQTNAVFRVTNNGTANELFRCNEAGNFMIGTTTEIASSKLTIESTTQGFLPPRMTTTQKNAIATPASGLVVYDTTLGKLCVRGAAAWETITSI